jgi:hypothetical protein
MLIAGVSLVGCMHTVISGSGTPSPDGQYELWMAKHGASGKAYTARTKKRVYLSLGPSSSNTNHIPPTLKKKYVFVAGDLAADEHWKNSDEVTIEFYDFGDGVYVDALERGRTPSNHVATLRFVRDSRTGGFVEQK